MNLFLNLILVIFCIHFNVRETYCWGFRTNDENTSQLDDYESKPIPSAGQSDTFQLESSKKATVDSVGQQLTDDEKNHRQYGRQYKLSNVSVEYIPGKDNGTWNVEKQEKTIELSKEVLETQHATCQVTTEELVATAQATVTRVLRGLCNAKEMENRFYNMEIFFSNQLQMIKDMIANIEDRLVDQEEKVLRGQKQLLNVLSKNCGNSGNSGTFNGFQTSVQTPDSDRRTPKITDPKPSKFTEPDDDIFEDDLAGPREPEILKYNSSIHMEASLNGPPKKVFTYFWKIRHMQYKLTGWSSSRSLRSQSFYIFPSGYRMYLRIFPRQNDENFYIHVGVTKGEFDDSLQWPFPLKHKVHILDQTKEGRTFEDIASRIWDPNKLCSEFNWQKPIKGDNYECVGLGFPHDVLKQREYIRKDTIVIKLTVYLEP